MPTAPQEPRAPFNLHAEMQRFWIRVSEGMEIRELWSQFEKDARSGYRFYSVGLAAQVEGKSGFSRAWAVAKTLFWAILEKLSPARRVLLLFALVFLFLPTSAITVSDHPGQVRIVEFEPHFWGGLLLLIVLLLELADRVVMKRDLEIAKDIQTWLLPGAPLQLPGYALAYATRPANTVAGDYYDVILRPGETRADDRVLLVVADVAGKSIPAAMLMATFQASLRTLSGTGASLAKLVTGLNHYACTNSQGGTRFTTAFLAELDPSTGHMIYVNAGHNAPLLRRESVLEHLNVGGPPLGISEEFTYEVGAADLQPGDWLVIFTDGVVEAVNASGQEYEEPRLIQVVQDGAAKSPADLLRLLLSSLDAFVGNTPQHDDMTCLLIKRTASS